MDEKKPRKKKAAADKEHKTPWQETYAGVQEIQDFLMGRIMLRRNALTGLVESRWPAEYPGETNEWESLSSVTVNSLWAELSLEKPVRKQDMQNVIESDFVGLGFRFRTVRGYRHYQVVRRSADEMRVMRHRLPGGDGEYGGNDS